MNKEKVKELLQSKEFTAKLVNMKSNEEVKKLLNDAGAEVTDEDLKTAEEKGKTIVSEIKTKIDSKEIKEEDLDKISGGRAGITGEKAGSFAGLILSSPLLILGALSGDSASILLTGLISAASITGGTLLGGIIDNKTK